MAITTLSMILTVFVLNLHHISDRPVPSAVRKAVLIYLAKMLGVRTSRDVVTASPVSLTPVARGHTRKASVRLEAGSDESGSAILQLQPNGQCQPVTLPGGQSSANACKATYSNKDVDIRDFAKEWKKVAEVFDRLFFWLFLLAIMISTLVLFHPLIDAYMTPKWKGNVTEMDHNCSAILLW